MAHPLESAIMADIGLGNYPMYYIGSSSCGWIASDAARRLPAALKKRHDAGEEVAEPFQPLIDIMATVARRGGPYATDLTKTWEVASYVIQAHLSGYYESEPSKRLRQYHDIAKYLKEHYLPPIEEDLCNYHGRIYRYGADDDWT